MLDLFNKWLLFIPVNLFRILLGDTNQGLTVTFLIHQPGVEVLVLGVMFIIYNLFMYYTSDLGKLSEALLWHKPPSG